MSNITLETYPEGYATITIDVQDAKVNVLSSVVLKELKTTLENINNRATIKVLGFRSSKPNMFIAGADITEIDTITDIDDAKQKAFFGQEVFNLIESLPYTTVAMIDGACMGGGFELALACNLRIASDNPKCKMGLPEVSLGILPGFGGTQRMPKISGLMNSLDLILGGKIIDCKKAYKMKLVDTYFKKEFFEKESMEILKALATSPTILKKAKARRNRKGLLQKVLEKTRLGRRTVFKKARAALFNKTSGHYPAPLAALEVIQQTYPTHSDGYLVERTAFSKLAVSDISKNLIQVFYTSEALKKEVGTPDEVQVKNIQSAVVVGAGVMGGGIAWALSMKDISVRMKDITQSAIQIGYASAAKMYGQLVKIRKLNKYQVDFKMRHISSTLDYSGFNGRDIAIEAVIENMEVKKSVLKECESALPPNSILASNTSSLSITEMATALERPAKFVGMHFFNPVNRMPLVEVIAGTESSPSTIATIVALSKKLGKTPIVVKDCPGFLVNRILIPYINEAVLLWEEGANILTIDRLIKKFGMPMGPFSLTDEVGIDIGHHVAKILEEGYGTRMKTADVFTTLVNRPDIRGKKSGKGFYLHSGKKKGINPDILEIQNTFIQPTTSITNDVIMQRCMYSMINEAARCIEEDIVQSASYLDMAMILGTGYPPFRGGPLRYADSIGLSKVCDELTALAQQFGHRFEPAKILVEYAQSNKTFY